MNRPLRLWPGIAAALLIGVGMFGVPFVIRDAGFYAVLGGVAGALLVIIWWLFFSRAPWLDRIGALVMMVVAAFAIGPLLHGSIAGAGMGYLFFVLAVPIMALGLVVWAVASRGWSNAPRLASMAAAILLACGTLTLVRTGGITGTGKSDFHWRWTPTPEERLLSQATPAAPPVSAPETPRPAEPEKKPSASPEAAPAAADAPPVPTKPAEWPGFRGPKRDSIIAGVRINTDWKTTPPVELWRRPIGPGWSSFAVDGDRIYTQEQRGEDEVVACYNAATGAPVWIHRDKARFYESNGGAGPRATPTLSGGRVYTLGATGIVNTLDARTGRVVWSRNGASDTGMKLPGWGFSGSPLVVNDLIVVAVSGRLAAYDIGTGKPRWMSPPGGGTSYSSPHLMTVGGVDQVVLLSGTGTISVALADGTPLWRHDWEGAPIVQPARIADGDILVTTNEMSGSVGLRRLKVTQSSGKWTVEERWTSRGLKPYFNDYVVHEGHVYGFDGGILSCIDLADGARKWKGGRYGHGQLILLPEQDVLLVLSEEGDLALVNAAADEFKEFARLPAIEGKTWNHPVLVRDLLLVRNGEEMAAFRMRQK